MKTYMKISNLTKSGHRRKRFRRLKPTCAMSYVPARNPFGHVVIYAPAPACELRLPPSPEGYGETRAPHHIGECRELGTVF